MPPVVAFITTIGTIFGFAGTAATIAGAAIIAGTAVIAKALMPKIDMGVVDTDRARQTTVRSTIEPRKLVYGETMISGVVSFAQVNGSNNKNLHQVISIAGHKLTSIDKIFLDDYSIDLSTQVDGNGDVTSGKFAKKTNESGTLETMVHIETRDGSSTQTAYSNLVTAFAGTGANAGKGYESTHRGDNVASIYTRWTIHEGSSETWDEVGGIQNIKAVVKGKAVYDPRLDVAAGNDAGDNPTTAAYIKYSDGATTATHQRDLQGQNPALMLADYLMDSTFGLGLPASKIDWSAVITAADACDFLVPIPVSQTQKRFFGSGVIFGSDNHRKSISKILSGMNGDLIYSQGKYIIKAGIHQAATSDLAFTEDDIAGEFTVKTSIPRADRFNTIKGMFIDPESKYKMTEFSPRTVSGAVARDNGEVLEQEIKLTFTSDRYVAQRLAIKKVNQSFLQTTLSLPVNLKGMKVAVGDRITLALNDFATIDTDWNPSKEFKVVGWSFSESGNGAIDLSLIEDDSARYADPAEGEYNQISNTGVITTSLADVPLPTNFTATAGYNSVNLAWTNPTNIGTWEQIWIYASDTTTPPTTPIEKFRGTAFTHQIAGGTAQYYWIQAVKYPLGATPASGSTNTSKSALVPFGAPTAVTALKIANAVMASDSIDTAQIIDDAVGSAQIAQTLQSDNYSVQNQTGWEITKSGDATFNNAVVRGNISATTGSVGGFTISSTDLIAGDGETRVSLSTDDGISLGNNTFASAPFRVTRAGALTATNATITGSISATTGAIGGFDIGSDYIKDAADSMGLSSTVTVGDDVRFWAGETFANRATAPFRVTEAGALSATDATIEGAVTATTLTVSEANITNALTLGGGVLQDGSGNNLTATTTLNANQVMSEVTGVLSQAQHAIPSFYRIETDTAVAPTNAEFNTEAARLPKVDDIAITTDTTVTNPVTPNRTYGWTCTAAGTASTEATWEEITDFISGDLLVDGTITADNIAANAVTAGKINVANLQAINSNLGNITAGTLKGGTVPDANAAPSGTESGSFFNLTDGKFVVGDASKSLLFDGSNMTMTGDVRVKGTVEADTLIVNNSFQFVGKEFFIASGVEAGGITAAMLSGSAINLLQGSLAQSVGGSNGDFKEGTGTFTTSGGSIVLGTSGNLFDHGELGIDLEANFSISWNSTTNYGVQNLTLQFQVSTDGTNYTNVGTSHSVTISTYDLSSYYPNNYYVHYSYTDITETISAGSLTNNTDYYIRALISSVPTSVTGQTPSFTFSANEGVTGVTSTGGNADTLDNLDSTAFLRSNVNDTLDADLVITGDLTVQGTTTTINVADLTVADKDITLNYSTGDSSATANNAGIIIQDAVSATADASLLWKTASDTFEFSHGVVTPTLVSGDIDIGDGTAREELKIKSNSYAEIHYFIKNAHNNNVLTEYIRAGVALIDTNYNQTIGDYFLYSPQSGKMILTVPQNGDPLRRNNGAITIIDSTNYDTYALPLSGGTLTGALSGTAGTFTGAVSGASFELSGISVIDSNQNINAASISTDAITSSGDITLTSTATSSPSVNFNSSTATDPAVDMAIKLVGEDLHFYEPEDSNKVHFKILDDTGVDAPFGYWVNGTRMADASRNLTVGTIGSGAITSTGGLSGTTGTFSGVVYAGSRVEINGGAGWAYTRLKDSDGTKWDIAANANDNSSALQFRPFGSGTNATLMSTGGNWTIAGTVSSGAITSSGVITAAGLVSSTTGSSYSSGTVAAIFKDTTARGTVRIRSDADKAAELFFDVNGAVAWDISARNSVGSYDLQFFGRANTPNLTNVAGPFFTITQAGFADALAGFKVNAVTVIDSSRNLTAANGNFSGIVGVNKATNSAVGLSVGSDASTTASYGLEVCNSTSNTRFIVDGLGNSTFYQSDNSVGMAVTSGGDVDINSGALKMGGTTVISSGRNLANIGSYTGSGQVLITGQYVPFKAVGTVASGYTEVQILNDTSATLVMGSVGSTYSSASFAGSRYIYSTGGDFRIKSAGALKLYSGGTGDTGDLAVTFDTSRNATFTGTITSNGAAYIGGNLFFGVTGTSSFIGRESTVNLGLYADGAHKFYTYTTAWTEQATIDDSGLTVLGQITVTNDDHNYLKIESAIAKEQMVRFKNSLSSNWYAGLRTSAGLSSTAGFHIYSTAYGNDVLGLKTDGSMVVAAGATFGGGITATTGTFSGAVNGVNLAPSASGSRWGVTAEVASNGVMEVGRYIDFHATNADTSDYGARLDFDGTNLIVAANASFTGNILQNGYLRVASGTSSRFGGDTYSSAVGMYDNASNSYQTPVLVIRKDFTGTGALNTAPVGLFMHNGTGKWVVLSMGARETNTAGNTVSIAGIASERTAGTLNAWATGNLHLWTKSASTKITNMVLKSDGDTEIPGGNLYVNGNILGKGIRSANRGELHLNATASDKVAEIFFGHGSGFTEANIRWGISDRGSTGSQAGLLHFYKGPAFGSFTAVATLNANNNTFSVLNGYKVNDVTVIDSSRNIEAVNVQATGGINLRRNSSPATGISFYNTTYYNWQVYMSPAGTTGCGPNANLTAPTGLAGVTSWALRSRMEGVSTYGWIWETGAGGGGGATATAKMSLQSTTGNLQIAGSFTAGANITAYSDERLKDNIKTLDGSKVLEMRGVSFTKDGKAGSGVIAQEIERIAPELVEDDGTYKSVAYGNLVGYLIENAKQQQSEIDELKALVKKLMEK